MSHYDDDDDYRREHPADARRAEPEIIPPGRSAHRGWIWISIDEAGGPHRIHMARPGPFTIILALAILGLIGLVMLIVLLSVALIWIPVVIALVTVFVVSVTFRQWWWRFRNWLAPR